MDTKFDKYIKIIDMILSRLLVATCILSLLMFIFPMSYNLTLSCSMYPTIKDPCVIWGTRLFNKDNLKRGDIIMFEDTKGVGTELVCKRIIGLPNEKIEIKEGSVFVNGEKLQEDYLTDEITTDYIASWGAFDFAIPCGYTFEVPQDSFFVLGDNRHVSYDSRYWTFPFVNKKTIESKFIFSIHLPEWIISKEIN